ncbi:MAG: recombination-associated protein RdgC [Halothiobacillaceae bacterium]|jgi:recombination associated protein RdgC|nr:recombination-associated protein RdgC [Halothiobacillaceae bacterium]HQS02720.1 recombination-associated protein RdgC [Halothiobacillus sp.]HUM99497.1 recombination-associated protein RdgC [Halothiobacillus sp.]
MFFRQLTVYRLETPCPDFTTLDATLSAKPFMPTRAQQVESVGWQPALGTLFVHETDGAARIVLQREERSVPAAVVREEADNRLRARGGATGEPTRAERSAMQDAVMLDLLPQAFPRQGQTQAIIDAKQTQVWFDTATATKVERLSLQLREALGQWRMVPLFGSQDISSHLSAWLLGAPPLGFEIGEAAKLVDLREGSTITVAKLALPDPHVMAHLHEGMKVDQLELIWQEQIRFMLKADGSLARIKPTEQLGAEESGEIIDDADQQRDADQRLMVEALRRLILDLTRVLNAPIEPATV